MKKILIALSATMAMTGCSTILNGSTENITIRSSDPSHEIYVDGVFSGKGTTGFAAERGTRYVIEAKAKDCAPGIVNTSNSFEPTTLLGIFIDFGLFSIPIDLISGAAFKPDQKTYFVSPVCAAK
ncbi:MAG: hypothetical protein ACRC6V_06675 [Bacteroidales bacterium]